MNGRLKWLGQDVRMKDEDIQTLSFSVSSWEGGRDKEIFKGNRNFLGGCKEGGFEQISN